MIIYFWGHTYYYFSLPIYHMLWWCFKHSRKLVISLTRRHHWTYSFYILNQIPYATGNTFLNNSKPTECRLLPFKPWLDKCLRHSVIEFERSAWFHARAFAFCLMVPPFEKVTKRRQKITFTLCKCFVFVICWHSTTLKWLKLLQMIKICVKMVKAMTPKTQPIRTFQFLKNGYHISFLNLLIVINN